MSLKLFLSHALSKSKLLSKTTLSDVPAQSMSCEESFSAACSVATAFKYLSDFSNCAQWDATVVSARKITAGVPMVGTVFAVVIQFGLAKVVIQYKLTVFEDQHLLVFEGRSNQFRVVDRIKFTENGLNQCRINYAAKVIYLDWLGAFAPLLQPVFRVMGAKAVARLKHCLDGAQSQQVDPAQTLNAVNIATKDLLADAALLPGLLKFTRVGYRSMLRRSSAVLADLTGKVFVITGATSGIGRAVALALMQMNAEVVVVARRRDKAEKLQAWLAQETGKACQIELADMSLLADVKALSSRLMQQCPIIDGLINNAGELLNTCEQTQEGLEKSFATLLLGPYALTEALIPALTAAAKARVVNVSSGGMYTQAVRVGDLNYRRGRYDGPIAYARAKRGLVDMTEYWAKHYAHTGIAFHAMHPGWVDTPGVERALPWFYRITKPFLRSPSEGADTIVWLVVAPEAAEVSGGFWLDRACHTTAVFPFTRTTAKNQARLASILKGYTSSGHTSRDYA
jgi:NAD(P)-dependent dehydrogenase (short-subunit alcohol dehydrogenase family)